MERMLKPANSCHGMDEGLAELLLEPKAGRAGASARAREHVRECARCGGELQELRATMALLDSWDGPEPSAYFLSRLEARLREEREAAPAGWWSRLRARMMYGPGPHVRPLAAMALTMILLVGGGTYLGITNWDQPAPPPQPGDAAMVHDLETLATNAQLLDQLETISDSDNNGD